MKKNNTYIVIVFLLMVLQKTYAVHQEELFLRGNKYAAQYQWESALQEYQKIENKSAAVLYNMGICYEQVQQLERAQLYWLKALAIAGPTLYARIDKKLSHDMHRFLFVRYAGLISAGWSLLCIQIVVIFFWYSILLFLFFRKIKTGILVLLIGILAILMCCLYSKIIDHRVIGFVKKQEASLFAGPSEQYVVVGLGRFGTWVTIHEIRNDWYRVATQSGNGWMLKESIESLE